MYTINHKIVWISILFQALGCIFWLYFAPEPLAALQLHTIDISILYVFLAIISYVYFYAWALNKMMIASKIEMCVVIFLIWLFYLLPNLFIAKEMLNLDQNSILYIVAFSASGVLINSFVLPFSRSSRSIFKT